MVVHDCPLRPALDLALEEHFVPVSSVADIPPRVRSLLRGFGRPWGSAQVGKPFFSVDGGTRRFSGGAHAHYCGAWWLLSYEHGCDTSHYHIVLLRIVTGAVDTEPGIATAILSGQWLSGPRDRQAVVGPDQLMEALRNQDVDAFDHW